jgi:hypothetical protein
LSIKYRPDKRFFFVFHVPKSRDTSSAAYSSQYLFTCFMSPGRESVEESMVAGGRSSLLAEIREWLRNLYADIVSAPAVRQFEAHSAAIERLKQRLDELPDEPVPHADAIQFRKDLDRMKNEFSAQLKQATSNKKELARKIQELSRDIEFLKQTIESMTTRQWGEVFFLRVRKWTQKFSLSLRPLAAGTRLVKGILPEGMTDALDKVADTADGIADVVEKIPSLDGDTKNNRAANRKLQTHVLSDQTR